MDFSNQRLSYEKNILSDDGLPVAAFTLLKQWLEEAIKAQVVEPYAISLATSNAEAQPSVRVLLVRQVTDDSLIFYTNYDSAKADALTANPKAEALFFWHELERQVRIRGQVHKIDRATSEAYFQQRPHDSQVAAWVSQPQSGVVADRARIEASFANFKEKYPEGSHVPMPDFWGGYELVATEVEFWQGRANRMHDRIVYTKDADAEPTGWRIQRLLP